MIGTPQHEPQDGMFEIIQPADYELRRLVNRLRLENNQMRTEVLRWVPRVDCFRDMAGDVIISARINEAVLMHSRRTDIERLALEEISRQLRRVTP